MPNTAVDRLGLILFARVTGYMDVNQVLRLSTRLDIRLSELGESGAHHTRLIDLTEAKVASPNTIAALGREIVDPRRRSLQAKRVAFFGASPLVALQINRLCMLKPDMALFADRRAAYSWLRSSDGGKAMSLTHFEPSRH